MANSRDFTGKNRKFTGTKGITTPKGTTGERVGSESGELRFNTTTELMEYYDGTQWKPIDAPPTISNITTSDGTGTNTILNADGSTLYTITINGGNFSLSPVVKFTGSTGTEYTAGNVTRVSSSQITCTTLNSMGTTDDPYDIRVTNTSGLSATLDDAFSYNAAPVFTVASGQLGTIYSDGTQTISGSTFNAGATDAEGNSITHTIVSGSLPSGLSIASSTGYITGATSGNPALGNYSFIVRASTTEGVAERQFSIQVIANPFISATGGTETTSAPYKIHTFNSSGSFVVSNAGTAPSNSVDYLIIAGGGGSSTGGGGAGGYRAGTTTVTAQTYSITIGQGGAGARGPASSGGDSSALGLTSTGGGKGGATDQDNAGGNGGSGGGGAGDGRGGPGGIGTPGQGNNGGTSGSAAPYTAAGGGGAGAAGNANSGSTGGSGGAGTTSSISGSPVTRAGGGGGGAAFSGSSGGGGGSGGGGAANPGPSGNGSSGTANTGGGGGGYINYNIGSSGGTGGSGVVIIRYTTP